MPKLLRSFLFLGATSLWAGERIVEVTPTALKGWTLTGFDAAALAPDPTLSLPANGQLARTFLAHEVAVKLVTRPTFAASPADWPVLEIGSAALIFRRSGDHGELALALEEQAPVSLPFAIALAEDGRSQEPLTLIFTRSGAISVSIGGQALTVPTLPVASDVLEVVASAGAAQPWTMERMAVIFTASDSAIDATGKIGVGALSDETETAASHSGALDGAPSAPRAAGPNHDLGSAAKNTAAPAASTPVATRSSALEIFTPPSVRSGRADAIRAAAASPAKP